MRIFHWKEVRGSRLVRQSRCNWMRVTRQGFDIDALQVDVLMSGNALSLTIFKSPQLGHYTTAHHTRACTEP